MVATAIAPQAPRKPTVVERNTRGGRKLFYHLDVIQQPERARACGSGPKSSTDRRPVDPPPVVELRIFEGPTFEQAKDVTFLYNANFFLYTTLEHARAIAHGRGQPPQSSTPPILTGMPVSGMAYLDRPQEAGYFLFPDLSVRHEGIYRLVFNLYEETKDDKDKDIEPADGALSAGGAPEPASFDFRMEVKSDTFTVYSAKKFPGLTESTTLSRTVAEQGCRVRIRRDVRMRRRDGKPSGGNDYENEDEYARRRRTETPEYRARSSSNTSVDRTPYMPEPQRRPSGVVEYPPPPPSFAGPEPSATRHLTFGSQSSAQYPPQPPPNQQPPSVPASPSYQAPQPAPYTHQAAYPPPPQAAAYPYSERPPSQQYSAPHPSPQRESYSHDYRRPSSSSYAPPAAGTPVMSAPVPEREYRSSISQAPPPPPPPAAPHRTSLPSVADLTASVDLSTPSRLPPMPSPTTDRAHRMSFSFPLQPAPPAPLPPIEPRSMKRSMDEAFPTYSLMEQRYQDGRRQEVGLTDDLDDMPKKFVYKRADGSVGKRDENGRPYH